jgi:hypothetical protein
MKKLMQRLNISRPQPVRMIEQHGTRPTHRRDQPGANEYVTIGGVTFRPKYSPETS